ncbi:unnamed protein product [Mytilus coruscus]|uniref:Uncharacterized protein n=1 Tax=Mytilus coruscus TaxID=42192 RepID=A0A6J8EI72_MYTCO|nr:unnamed protein product [Mytilus coruscus]
MKRDKLYFNEKLVKPDEVADVTEHKEPQRSTTRPSKRSWVNSTPEREGTSDNHGRHKCIDELIDNDLCNVNKRLVDKSVINIITLNVCGLKRRIQYPEFLELINEFSILCFVETKTDNLDVIDLPGYKFVMKIDLIFNRVKLGGIVLGLKNHYLITFLL